MNKITLCSLFFLLCQSWGLTQYISHGPVTGAVGADSARVYFRTHDPVSVELQVSEDLAFSNPMVFATTTLPEKDNSTTINVNGLLASTRYYLRFEVGGMVDSIQGSFKTFPLVGDRTPLVITAGSCQETENMNVFLEIPKHNPDLFIHLGDWTYPAYQLPDNYPEDWEMVELSYRRKYEEIHMREMLRDLPVDYVYDDDDFTEGGSTRNFYTDVISSGPIWNPVNEIINTTVPDSVRRNCIKGYMNFFPGYPLVDTSEGIFHQFTIGNVEVFFLDIRGTQDPITSILKYDSVSNSWSYNPDPDATIVREKQMIWLLNGLSQSTADWKIICSGAVFNQTQFDYLQKGLDFQAVEIPNVGSGFKLATAFAGEWAGFQKDQQQLLDYIDSADIKDVFVLSGQSHNNVIDDGTNAGLPELNASGLSVTNLSLSQGLGILANVFGLGPVEEDLWNGGGNGVGNDNLNNGFGKVEIFGADSARLSAIDEVGEVMGQITLIHSSLLAGNSPPGQTSNGIRIFPNPTEAVLYLQLKSHSGIDLSGNLEIANVQGVKVLKQPLVFNGDTMSLDISTLSTGKYFISINSGQGLQRLSFVKK